MGGTPAHSCTEGSVTSQVLGKEKAHRGRAWVGERWENGVLLQYPEEKAGTMSCSEKEIPLPSPPQHSTSCCPSLAAGTSPPSCRGTAQSLFRGSLLMLALAQRWFLWQLQRQMQERLQPRYRQPRYPRMFLPKYRQMATWHVRTDPTVTAPGVQRRLWANNTKNILQTLFPTSLPTFPTLRCCWQTVQPAPAVC